MVILRTRNKITDFLMILAWASPFKITHLNHNKDQAVGYATSRRYIFKHEIVFVSMLQK